MKMISKLVGKSASTDADSIEKQLEHILIEDEEVHIAFKAVRDLVVFTSRRLLFVDKQGLTGKKVEYLSYPYKSITHYSVETAGHMDMDFDLKVWIRGVINPIEKKLKNDREMALEVAKILTKYTT